MAPCRSPFSADNVGPLARTARDCARLLRTIAGHDAADPTSSTEPVPDYEAALDGVRGLRIGVPANFFFDGADSEVRTAFDAAMKVLESRGAKTDLSPIEYARHHAASPDAHQSAAVLAAVKDKSCGRPSLTATMPQQFVSA
jgi:Asp-tRNA(Asn)/Glu-tRNA(Gln) amidotransferase A subunit family amidase